jgi:hypothetical protein
VWLGRAKMEAESVHETSVNLDILALLSTKEEFIEYFSSESFKTYIIYIAQ